MPGSDVLQAAPAAHTMDRRVRRLLARALQLVAKRKHGWQLGNEEVYSLAAIGDLEQALRYLASTASVAYAAPGRLLSPEAQLQVAVAEAVAEASGGTRTAGEQLRFRRRLG